MGGVHEMSRLDKYSRKPGGAGKSTGSRDVGGVPLSTRLATLFGSIFLQIGAVFFALGMVFWWVFGAGAGVATWFKLSGDVQTVQGTVTGVEETGISEGGSDSTPGTPIYRVLYSYSPDGAGKLTGASYGVGYNPGAGTGVTVEYAPDDPLASRIEGTRTSPVGLWVLFIAIFPLTGLVFMAGGFRRGAHTARLIALGKLTRGRMVDKSATGSKINNQKVYRYTFEFEDEAGETHRITDKTHHTQLVEDEELERILYNPNNPSEGKLVDTLPGRPKVNEDGTLSPVGFKKAFFRMILPVGGVAAHLVVGVFYYAL